MKTKFKIGDRVRVIKESGDSGPWHSFNPGNLGEVVECRLSGNYGVVVAGTFQILDPRQIELVGKPGRPAKARATEYVVFYDENDHDPMQEFATRDQVKKWLKEAHEDRDIDFGSIRVFKVDHELKIGVKFDLRKK